MGRGKILTLLDPDPVTHRDFIQFYHFLADVSFPRFFTKKESTGGHPVQKGETDHLGVPVLKDRGGPPALDAVKDEIEMQVILKEFQMIKRQFFQSIRTK
jgi:hypothetical protein